MPTGDEFSVPCESLLTGSHLCCMAPLTRSGYTVLPDSAAINPTSVSVSFHPPSTSANPAPIRLLTNGEPEANIDEERASEILKEEDLEVVVDLGAGSDESRVWTCDFSHVSLTWMRQSVDADVQEYVTINGSVSRTRRAWQDELTMQYRS